MTSGNTMNLKNGESQEQSKAQNSEALECFIYREDVVKCHKQEGMLGVVLEAPGDSDSDSSNEDDSESEDSENGHADGDGHGVNNNDIADSTEKNDHLTGHQVRVMCLDGSETVQNLCDVTVTDRVFMHGDTVSSVSDLKGQLGVVLDVDIMVDLLSPSEEIVKNVSSRKLKRIREFSVGDYVVHGPWLGRVEEVVDNVTVLFDDGSVCKVMKADPLRLKPISKSISDESGFPYYPGQRVRAASAFVFKGSRWLSGLWKASRLEGTVSKVQAGSVFVYWIASSNLGEGTNRKVPPEEQNPKDLTLLSCFPHADWQLGEWCLFNDKAETNDNDNCLDDLSSKLKNACKNSACKSESAPDDQDDSISGSLENGYSSKSLSAEKSDDVANSFQPSTSSNVCKSSITDDNKKPEACKSSAQSNTCTGSLPSSKESTRDSWPAYRKRLRKVFFKRDKKSLKRDESFERAFLIVNITTKVDVAWQNGTRDVGLESKSLVPIKNPGDQDFFPEQYVMEKALNENEEFSEVRRVGVVKSVNAKECVACIKWLKPVSTPEDPREFEKVELVSVYELEGHPDYDYQHGDVVVRLSPVSGFASSVTFESSEHEKQEEPIDAIQDHVARANVHCGEVGETSEAEPDAEDSDLSWVGHIIGLKDGDVEVTWGDGTISKVGPQAIYVVGREDDGESFDGGSEYSDGASWETVVDENDIASLATGEDPVSHSPNNSSVKGENSTRSPEDSAPDKSGPLSSAISFVASLASGLFSHGRKQVDMDSDKKDLTDSNISENIVPSLKETAVDESNSQEHESMDCHGSDDACLNVDTSLNAVGTCSGIHDSDGQMLNDMDSRSTTTVGDCDPSSFKHFDITDNPLDHHFLGSSDQADGGKKWVKKVQQEWNILEKNLPDAIYVRAFEDRMDLIRAVIVGACGTPYQDGLFFFDFQLPPDYPQVPPSVYYHSGGLRVNPNLYVDGKVCLSLLNTWTGKGNEVWDPASSSILQVLVSLQGLVLNSKPYFNEAGYEKQIGTIEGEKNYLPYNENTFLLNLKSMTYLMRRPPMHFEEFVTDHFRKRGYYILKACHAYSKGCLVGSLTKDACTTEESYTESCSAGFKLMLKKILPRLFAALSEVGADCQEFDHFQEP